MGACICDAEKQIDNGDYVNQMGDVNLLKPIEQKKEILPEILSERDLDSIRSENKKKASTPKIVPDFEMDLQWFLQDLQGNETKIIVDSLKFSSMKSRFFTQGVDMDGTFAAEGSFDLDGKAKIELTHEKQDLSKKFEGSFQENVINGSWKSAKETGTFKFEIVSNIWNSNDIFICFKSTIEPFGIGHFPYGWAVLSGTPGSEKQANVYLNFPDGKTGTLECTILEDNIYGKLQLPGKGEEDVYLVKKNQFE